MDIYTKAETVTGTVYIWAIPLSQWEITEEDKAKGRLFKYAISTCDNLYIQGSVLVHEVCFSAQVPAGLNLVEKAVETLEASIAKKREEFLKEEASLREQIKGLLLLTDRQTEEGVIDHE